MKEDTEEEEWPVLYDSLSRVIRAEELVRECKKQGDDAKDMLRRFGQWPESMKDEALIVRVDMWMTLISANTEAVEELTKSMRKVTRDLAKALVSDEVLKRFALPAGSWWEGDKGLSSQVKDLDTSLEEVIVLREWGSELVEKFHDLLARQAGAERF